MSEFVLVVLVTYAAAQLQPIWTLEPSGGFRSKSKGAENNGDALHDRRVAQKYVEVDDGSFGESESPFARPLLS